MTTITAQDVANIVQNIESWILYGSIVLATVLIVYAIFLKSRGDERATKYLASGFIAIVIGVSGWTMIQAFVGSSQFMQVNTGGTINSDVLYGLLIGACFVASVVYFATGKLEKGAWQLLGVFLLISVLLLIPEIVSIAGVDLSSLSVGGFIVFVRANPASISPGQQTNIEISIQDDYPQGWNVNVSFGDGSYKEFVTYDKQTTVQHTYTQEGSYGVTVLVKRVNQSVWGVGYCAVDVRTQTNVFGWIFSYVTPFLYKTFSPVINLFQTPIAYAYVIPLLNPNTSQYDLYNKILGFSLAAFLLYFIFNVVWAFFTKENVDTALIESLKESVAVLIVLLLAPYLYNLSAGILNAISMSIAYKIDIAPICAGIAAYAGTALVVGYFAPYIASLMAMITMAYLTLVTLTAAKYWLTLSLIIVSPVLAVSYLHPAFKSAVRFYAGLLASLMLASPLSAVMLALITTLFPQNMYGTIAYTILSPFLVLLIPTGLSMSITGNVMGGSEGLARVGSYVSLGTARAAHGIVKEIYQRVRSKSSGSTDGFSGGGGGISSITLGGPAPPDVGGGDVTGFASRSFVTTSLPTPSTALTARAPTNTIPTRIGDESVGIVKADSGTDRRGFTVVRGIISKPFIIARVGKLGFEKVKSSQRLQALGRRLKTNAVTLGTHYAQNLLYHYTTITGRYHPRLLKERDMMIRERYLNWLKAKTPHEELDEEPPQIDWDAMFG